MNASNEITNDSDDHIKSYIKKKKGYRVEMRKKNYCK